MAKLAPLASPWSCASCISRSAGGGLEPPRGPTLGNPRRGRGAPRGRPAQFDLPRQVVSYSRLHRRLALSALSGGRSILAVASIGVRAGTHDGFPKSLPVAGLEMRHVGDDIETVQPFIVE